MRISVGIFVNLVAIVILGIGATLVRADADLLQVLSEQSRQIKALDGRFEQEKIISVLPVPITSSGRFSFKQGESVEWQLEQPVQQTIRLSPAGITLEVAGKPATNLGEQVPAQGVETITRVFMAVISGRWETLREHFEIEASGVAGKWRLKLTPRSPALGAYMREIHIYGGEFTERLTIAEANGDSTNIRLIVDKAARLP